MANSSRGLEYESRESLGRKKKSGGAYLHDKQ